jgi:hypothetical protein
MPSLGSHLVRSRQVANQLALEEIDADRGSYYLGSTAPDIRVITRLDRSVTHFFELDELGPQDSVARMFESNPQLARPAGLEVAIVAFMCGYLTHLVYDEAYIEHIYRPLFGAHSEIDDDPRSNVLDRALQYELDRQDREDQNAMREIQAALEDGDAVVDGIPFIEQAHLVQWNEVSMDIAGQAPDYSRFRRMMERHLDLAGYDRRAIDECCEDPQGLVTEAFEIVSHERVSRFWSTAADDVTSRVLGYVR